MKVSLFITLPFALGATTAAVAVEPRDDFSWQCVRRYCDGLSGYNGGYNGEGGYGDGYDPRLCCDGVDQYWYGYCNRYNYNCQCGQGCDRQDDEDIIFNGFNVD